VRCVYGTPCLVLHSNIWVVLRLCVPTASHVTALHYRCLEAISRGLTAKARTFKMLRTKPEALKEEEEAGGCSAHQLVQAACGTVPDHSALSRPSHPSSFQGGTIQLIHSQLCRSVTSSCLPQHCPLLCPAGDSLLTLLQRTMSAEVSLMVQEDHRLTGHTGPVLSLAYDELQHRLYTAGLDCTIKVRGRRPAQALAQLKREP
jgi:hypothetical protein